MFASAPATIAEVAAELERLADATGESAYRRAARALYQQPAGRPPVDDRNALAEVRWLISTGKVASTHAALLQVARAICGRNSIRATAERLRKKLAAD